MLDGRETPGNLEQVGSAVSDAEGQGRGGVRFFVWLMGLGFLAFGVLAEASALVGLARTTDGITSHDLGYAVGAPLLGPVSATIVWYIQRAQRPTQRWLRSATTTPMLILLGILFAATGYNLTSEAATSRLTTIAGVTRPCEGWNQEAAILESTWHRYGMAMVTVNELNQAGLSAPIRPKVVRLLAASQDVEDAVRAPPDEAPVDTAALTPLRNGLAMLVHSYELTLQYIDGGPDSLGNEIDPDLALSHSMIVAGERALKARAELLHAACPAPVS